MKKTLQLFILIIVSLSAIFVNISGFAKGYSTAENSFEEHAALVTGDTKAYINPEVTVYPNPVTDNATVKINTDNNNVSSVIVSDIIGNKIMSLNLSDSSGIISKRVDFSQLRSGMYFISVYSENKIIASARFVKS